MTMTLSPNAVAPCHPRPLVNVPICRQESCLNSAMIFLVLAPPMIYAASDVETAEYARIKLKKSLEFVSL